MKILSQYIYEHKDVGQIYIWRNQVYSNDFLLMIGGKPNKRNRPAGIQIISASRIGVISEMENEPHSGVAWHYTYLIQALDMDKTIDQLAAKNPFET